jgi:hypothetical protein
MASKPVQRSLKHLRDNGFAVCIVEKFIKHPNMPFGKRIDAYGIGDLLACRPPQTNDDYGLIALVQCCSTDFAKHKEKILGIPEFATWKQSGGKVILHSWVKKGPRGKRKTYQLREEFL